MVGYLIAYTHEATMHLDWWTVSSLALGQSYDGLRAPKRDKDRFKPESFEYGIIIMIWSGTTKSCAYITGYAIKEYNGWDPTLRLIRDRPICPVVLIYLDGDIVFLCTYNFWSIVAICFQNDHFLACSTTSILKSFLPDNLHAGIRSGFIQKSMLYHPGKRPTTRWLYLTSVLCQTFALLSRGVIYGIGFLNFSESVKVHNVKL